MDSLFVDLGAHTGSSLRKWSFLKGVDVKNWDAISVEADISAYKILCDYIDSPSNDFKSITPIHAVVDNSDDLKCSFFEDSTNLARGSSTANQEKAENWNQRWGGSYRKVWRKPFDLCEFYQSADKIYDLIVIKMDIEGSEYNVLPSLLSVINPEKTPFIFVEFHDFKIGISRTVTDYIVSQYELKGVGFRDWDALEFSYNHAH